MALAIRPNCECCDRDLPNGDPEARICTFECTFCAECAETRFGGRCPNCGGDLVLRPTRPRAMLARHPPAAERVRIASGMPRRLIRRRRAAPRRVTPRGGRSA